MQRVESKLYGRGGQGAKRKHSSSTGAGAAQGKPLPPLPLPPAIAGFHTRRVNLTFRFVPDAHVLPFERLAPRAREDVRAYVTELAEGVPFFRDALAAAPPPPEQRAGDGACSS